MVDPASFPNQTGANFSGNADNKYFTRRGANTWRRNPFVNPTYKSGREYARHAQQGGYMSLPVGANEGGAGFGRDVQQRPPGSAPFFSDGCDVEYGDLEPVDDGFLLPSAMSLDDY